MEEITIPTRLAGWKARRLLRKHIRVLDQVVDGSTDLLCEKVICEQLLEHGKVGLSFAGEAKDMRRAFFAIQRMLD